MPDDIELEDQDGQQLRFGEFFSHKPAVVVFFYTRCNNPNKCSLTISKLARLQEAAGERGWEGQLKTAAITYDPLYDLPPRLQAYGLNRGVRFGTNDRFWRASSRWSELQSFFDLGVNFSRSLVNHHRIELFVLDVRGSIVFTFAHLQWDIDNVLDHAGMLM